MPAKSVDHSHTGLPTVSVIIPCYNAGLLLFRSLSSVFKQTKQALEVIVVDDASTADPQRLIRRYFPQVRYFRNDVNVGVASSRNRGAALAQGVFVAFLDADDAWATRKLERQLAEMQSTGSDLSFSGFRDVRSKTRDWGHRRLAGSYCDVLNAGLAFNVSTFLIRRSIFMNAGGFRDDLRRGEDIELFYRLALGEVRACYLPEALAWYFHDNEDQLTSAENSEISFAQLTRDLCSASTAASENLDATRRAATRHFVARYLGSVANGQVDIRLAHDIAASGKGVHTNVARATSFMPVKLAQPMAQLLLPVYRRHQQRHFWAQKQ